MYRYISVVVTMLIGACIKSGRSGRTMSFSLVLVLVLVLVTYTSTLIPVIKYNYITVIDIRPVFRTINERMHAYISGAPKRGAVGGRFDHVFLLGACTCTCAR